MSHGDDIEMGSIRRVSSFRFYDDRNSGQNSSRSSLENSRELTGKYCDIHVHDDVSTQGTEAPSEADGVLDTTHHHKIWGGLDNLRARLVVSMNLFRIPHWCVLKREGSRSSKDTMDVRGLS